VRHSSGGYEYVKAMGVALESRGIVQVSMNLTDYAKTPMALVFDAVKREAARYEVDTLESEIVCLVPAAAMADVDACYLQIKDFSTSQTLENSLKASH
jgi:glutamate formiminotransferase / 5-formyltetrahydrofolate cyclo-ligase